MKLVAIILSLLIYCITSAQQTAFYPGGANVFSLAGITANQEGVTAVYHNPAGVSSFEKSFGFDVSIDTRYVSGFYNPSFGLLKRLDRSYFMLGYYQNGISEYKTSNLFLGYSRQLFKNLSFGARGNYHKLSIQEYGKSNLLSIDLGAFSKVTKALSISAYYDALVSSKFNETFKKDNRVVVAFIYNPSTKVKLISEFEKNEQSDLSPKLGISYTPTAKIQFNCGVDLGREMVGFGFKYSLNSIQLAAAQTIHNQLGNIFALSINGEK